MYACVLQEGNITSIPPLCRIAQKYWKTYTRTKRGVNRHAKKNPTYIPCSTHKCVHHISPTRPATVPPGRDRQAMSSLSFVAGSSCKRQDRQKFAISCSHSAVPAHLKRMPHPAARTQPSPLLNSLPPPVLSGEPTPRATKSRPRRLRRA